MYSLLILHFDTHMPIGIYLFRIWSLFYYKIKNTSKLYEMSKYTYLISAIIIPLKSCNSNSMDIVCILDFHRIS